MSALLAVAVVVAGAFSLSRATVLGLQWCAITAVCLGSLLLLLALLGAAGARLRNRFSLLGFAALEAAVAIGLLLSGTWCLALAGGSATISDFTWEAMSKEVSKVLRAVVVDTLECAWLSEGRCRSRVGWVCCCGVERFVLCFLAITASGQVGDGALQYSPNIKVLQLTLRSKCAEKTSVALVASTAGVCSAFHELQIIAP